MKAVSVEICISDAARIFSFSWFGSVRVLTSILLLAIAPQFLAAQSLLAPLYLSNATLPPVTTTAGDGYLDKILDEMFARAGLGYELENLPPARGLMNANTGLLDGDAARVQLDPKEFENLIRVPEPIFHVVFAGLYLNPEIDVATWEEVGDYRVGYIRGWKVFERLVGPFEDSVVVGSVGALLDMLENNRIDIALMTIAPAREIAARKGMKRPLATKVREHEDLFLYLNTKNADKIDLLNNALLSMKADGIYDAIIAAYVAGEE